MIEFFSEIDGFDLSPVEKLRPVLEKIIEDYNLTSEYVNVIFMTDEDLLVINREYLRHDYYTDIITFNYSEDTSILEAELYISADRVKENASQYGVSFLEELYRIVIHGFLHLAGYEDKDILHKEVMQHSENEYIKLIVPRGTAIE
jgi:rRNA maturation RNase YbeY